MALFRAPSPSPHSLPIGPPITRSYSRPTFSTFMCSGGHWPSSSPCWPFAFSYYYPLSSSYFFYYTPWRFNNSAYRYYRVLADNAWDQRFHYYTPPQRQPYERASTYHEHSYKPLYQNYLSDKIYRY
ncbi:hypothetical protein niasHT_016906 [Heterodera trifolii]|uniref:Uncharacterized protein n=1 Tax=Heterodera trifolii TaxID=157864 RepID=A0ABD2KTS5_9BILA